MKLIFKGIVEHGDSCRVGSYDDLDGAVHIGGKDVVGEIVDAFDDVKKVIVGIADRTFEGDLFVETGWGYSEYTPMESDELKVGSHDLLEILERYEGQHITMFVSDEPINILEEME